jgi:hypothetical protein
VLGLRNLRTIDTGFFGSGSYLALEASYAMRYAQRSTTAAAPSTSTSALDANAAGTGGASRNDAHEYKVILFACSVSNVYPVTLDADYRDPSAETDPATWGCSRFYDKGRSIALKAGYDAHVVPVRNTGARHPKDRRTTHPQGLNLDFQAATSNDPLHPPTAHELVVADHHRCTPIAIVYCGWKESQQLT